MLFLIILFQVEKLNKEWQTKCDTLLKDAEVKHNNALAEIQKRNEHIEELVKATEEKVSIVFSDFVIAIFHGM